MIHRTADVSPSARIGRGCEIHAFAVVYAGVELDEGVVVLPHAVIGRPAAPTAAVGRVPNGSRRVMIGRGVAIGAHATIWQDVIVGAESLVGDQVVIRDGFRCGRRCLIGAGALVAYEVTLGNDVRIQDGAQITGRMSVGDGSMIAMSVISSNDRHLPDRMAKEGYRYDAAVIAGPRIGRKAFVGAGANLVAGIAIGDGAIVAAGALVARDVEPGARMMGEPAKAVDERGRRLRPNGAAAPVVVAAQ